MELNETGVCPKSDNLITEADLAAVRCCLSDSYKSCSASVWAALTNVSHPKTRIGFQCLMAYVCLRHVADLSDVCIFVLHIS